MNGGCLVPYDNREALELSVAAKIAGRSQSTLRNWCDNFGIGRKVVGAWMVSRVALAMHLDGNRKALEAYLSGDRSEQVAVYFRRFGLGDLLQR